MTPERHVRHYARPANGTNRRRREWCLMVTAAVLCGCGGSTSNLADLSSAWPTWQRIETTELPTSWRVEEASFAFDAWEAVASVSQLSVVDDATVLRFVDGEGVALGLRLPALTTTGFPPAMSVGDTVRVGLIRREGFEGVAQGLVVYDPAGRLLFLYDDGGYGAAFLDDGARAGLKIERTSRARGRGEGWAPVDVTFRRDGDSVVLAEGRHGRLGDTGLVVSVVVSREWRGPPMTDVDLTPLAYLVFRVEGA